MDAWGRRPDQLFGPLRNAPEQAKIDVHWQSVAAAIAAKSGSSVISGGPGSGKTTTVVRLLGLWQGIALEQGDRLRICLAAPTGKAAARLTESIGAAVGKLPPGVQANIPTEVTTLHRLPGSRPDTRHFIHHAKNPLHADLLVVDEESIELLNSNIPKERDMMANLQVDVLIIGAGPSGVSAAALIHKAGFKVGVVEKEKFPRFVIGESLLPRSMDLLEEAGLLGAVQKQQYIVKPGAVFLRGSHKCAFKFSEQFTHGWDYTYQVPRDHFDHILAGTIEEMGIQILWEHTVEDVQFADSGPLITVNNRIGEKTIIASRFVLDASGYGRVLPRLLDLEQPSDLAVRESLFTHVTGDKRPQGPEEGVIWICMLPDNAWLWIIPFSNGRTSVGVVAEPDFYAKLSGNPDEKLRAAFEMEENAAKRLSNVDFVFPTKQIKGYSISVKQLFGDGYALLGNATEFLDPVFSSGVTLALESANRSAQVVIKQLKGEPVDWQKEYADYLMAGVDAFRTYVKAWYDGRLPTIFFSSHQDPEVRDQICSVLAGYVWDQDNIYVTQHERAVSSLAKVAALMDKKRR